MKFLVKEIRSKTGELHFRRYRIFSCPLFSILFRSSRSYHKIYLLKPTTTLVFTGRRLNDNWGYFIALGELCKHIWFTNAEYREFKNKVERESHGIQD